MRILVFNSARVFANMDWCGLILSPERNLMANGIEARISTEGASCQVYVIPVDEESIIARETYTYLHQQGGRKPRWILIFPLDYPQI
jgi:acetate kinase